jgi:ribosomal subunit interface protein
MEYHVTHRHCAISSEEHQAAEAAAKHFTKFHDGIMRVDVIFDGHLQNMCEFNVRVQGQNVVSKESADTFLKAIHDAAAKIERQLVKLKERNQPSRETIRG